MTLNLIFLKPFYCLSHCGQEKISSFVRHFYSQGLPHLVTNWNIVMLFLAYSTRSKEKDKTQRKKSFDRKFGFLCQKVSQKLKFWWIFLYDIDTATLSDFQFFVFMAYFKDTIVGNKKKRKNSTSVISNWSYGCYNASTKKQIFLFFEFNLKINKVKHFDNPFSFYKVASRSEKQMWFERSRFGAQYRIL